MYDKQVGTLGGPDSFDIRRGVRQGDVLSPLLFNSALEIVMRRWNARLRNHGIKLNTSTETSRLTSVRFADDLIIYANSLTELTEMIDILHEELHVAGLELNAKKSRLFKFDESVQDCGTILVDVADGFMEVVGAGDTHKYLGNAFPGALRNRGAAILTNRLRCAWAKFHMFRHSLLDRHVDIKLRLKLFESVVSPSLLYGLTTAPLTQVDYGTVDAAQRKMLRSVVGHVPCRNDDWADMHRRMNVKMAAALARQGVPTWSAVLSSRKQKMQTKLANGTCNPLVQRVYNWQPKFVADSKLTCELGRGRGRPRTTWENLPGTDC